MCDQASKAQIMNSVSQLLLNLDSIAPRAPGGGAPAGSVSAAKAETKPPFSGGFAAPGFL